MRISSTALGAIALCTSVWAFSDTSPFILLSTAELHPPAPLDQLQSAGKVTQLAETLLASCPTDHYLVASQPNARTADLSDPAGAGGCDAVPNLCRAAEWADLRTRLAVAEVFGPVSADGLVSYIRDRCAREGRDAHVAEVVLPPLPQVDRALAVADNDYALLDSLEAARAGGSYSILFLAGPGEPTYQADFAQTVRTDLRRDAQPQGVTARRSATDQKGTSQSLFDQYQFFSPGIFIGLVVAVILVTILSIGLRALGSLEVTYAAFEQDMAQKARKKKQ